MSGQNKSWAKSIFGNLPPETTTPARKRTRRADAETSKTETRGTNEAPKAKSAGAARSKNNNSNWIDSFAPTCSEDMAMHPKKLMEIKNWFLHCQAMQKKNPAQLCLLTGPSGSGKTAAIRTLAKECGYLIQEWINPTDQDVVYGLDVGERGEDYSANTFQTSQVETFKNFLWRASRYKSLFDSSKPMLLVEDFPNFLIKDNKTFEEILQNYKQYAKAPLVFIATDSKSRSLNISYNLFSEEIKARHLITHIPVNAIASSLMQKAMKRFCSLMQAEQFSDTYKVPPAETIESITLSSQGDIRNALLNLHFASLKGCPQLSLASLAAELSTTKTGSRKRKKATSVLKSVGRDEALTMMHALGRVFYPKWSDDKKHLLHCPEDIADNFYAEPKKFIDFVHANYMGHFSEISDIVEAADDLSLADVMLTDYRDDNLAVCGLNLGVRSVMVTNRQPTSGFKAIRGPKRLNPDDIAANLSTSAVEQHITKCQYVREYSTYVACIRNQKTASV